MMTRICLSDDAMMSALFQRLDHASDPPSARLYCFPPAGQGPSSHRSWPTLLPRTEVWCLHLPGREDRLNEAPITDAQALVAQTVDQLRCDGLPTVVFGESMGALLAYYVAASMAEAGGRNGGHRSRPGGGGTRELIVAACAAPHRLREDAAFSDRELTVDLQDRLASVESPIERDELLAIATAALKTDIVVWRQLAGQAASPVSCPITVLAGREDEDLSDADVDAWRLCTTASCQIVWLPGGHDIVTTARPLVTEAVAMRLAAVQRS